MKKDYRVTSAINHDEVLQAISQTTGEVRQLPTGHKPLKKGFVPYKIPIFYKINTEVSNYLSKVLTPIEFRFVYKMCNMIEFETNSLKPLDDDCTSLMLEEMFKVNRREVKNILDKFFQLGIYGKFEYWDNGEEYKKFWILNPIIAHKGTKTKSDIIELFRDTLISRYFCPRK